VVTAGTAMFPWLEAPLRAALGQAGPHAVLVHGPDGVGQFEFTLALAQALLCEARPTPDSIACGQCAGCRLVLARTHPDLLVLVPDAMRVELGWGEPDASADEGVGAPAGRAKPSKEIRVDAVREAIAFAQATNSRGRGKVVVVHPAEAMNAIASNAMLKTLEEPVGQTTFLLASASPESLLPTVRSRCQAFALGLPNQDAALAWLERQGVADPSPLLAACGGRPLEAATWAELGIDGRFWRSLPDRLARRDASVFAEWPLQRVTETLLKLCHDALCANVAAPPRYFDVAVLGQQCDFQALIDWAAQLRRDARQSAHPWNVPLKVESLVAQAARALAPVAPAKTR
jgi:DNA polymerase III subunit delta'